MDLETLYRDIQTRFGLTTRLHLEILRGAVAPATFAQRGSNEAGVRPVSEMLAREAAETVPA